VKRALWATIWALAGACGAPAAEPASPPCRWNEHRIPVTAAASDAVDILFVVDDSGGTLADQRRVAEAIPALLDRLSHPPDEDADGYPDAPIVTDVHFGVVSSDLGTLGFFVRGCPDPLDGEDGILHDSALQTAQDCDTSYPRYLHFLEGDDPAAIAHDVACVEVLGEDGCSFQQPLAAARRALIDHAGDTNAGFLRDDTLLAIVFVTNGDDCSAADDDFFNSSLWTSPADVRCALEGGEYLDAPVTLAGELLVLREADPSRLVLAVVGAIPPDVECAAPAGSPESFDCVLSDPRMTPRLDDSGAGLAPSCTEPGGASAMPPHRLVTAIGAAALGGASAVLSSTCAPAGSDVLDPILAAIQPHLHGVCLSRPLPRAPDGSFQCRIREELMDAGPCPPSRVDLGLTDDEHRLCHVCQNGDGIDRLFDAEGTDLRACADATRSGDFWELTHEQGCSSTGQVRFRGDSMPGLGTRVSIACWDREC